MNPEAAATRRRPDRILAALGTAAVLVLWRPAIASDPSADVLVVRRCLVDYERIATLSSTQNEVLDECLVEPGDRVKAGQLLGRLRDEDVRAEIALKEAEAGSDVDVRLNQAKHAQAQHKARRTASLLSRNAASAEEYNIHRMEAEAAGLEVEHARHRKSLAQIQLKIARAHLRAREFVSPIDGVVVAVLKRQGEAVTPQNPVFKVVDVDRLQVTGQVDVTDSWRLRIGQPVRIVPEVGGADLAIEREVFRGRIVFVDTSVDPMTQTCKVVARIENRGLILRGGIEARMEIDPSDREEVTAAHPPAGRPQPSVNRPTRPLQ